MTGRERLAPPVAVVAAALVAYLGFACPFVLGGDQGEFTALFTLGGVAHPPGYPLWTLLLRAMSWMPGSTPSLAAARATAVVGAIAVGVLFAACRSWAASRGASVVACVVYAFAPLTWIYATQAEVFALNALLCSALLTVAGPACTLRGERRIVAAGLVVGLGLSHHPTFLAMGPIAILALVRGWGELGRGGRVRSSLLGAAALVLGLAPYDYVVWASHNPQGLWVWGGPMAPAGLLHHVLRIDFWQLRAEDTRAPAPGAHLSALWHSLAVATLVAGLPVALVGIVRGFLRDRGGAIAITASWLLAGPAVLAMLIGKPVGIYALIIERMHILPLLILSVPLAWGVDLLLEQAPRDARERIAAAAAIAVTVVDTWRVPPRIAEYERPTVEHYLQDTLSHLPPLALLVGVGDHRFFGFLVEQRVLGVRPDVVYVDAGMLRTDWYRARVAAALGDGVQVASDPRELVAVEARSGRQAYLTDSVEQLAPAGFDTMALGTVVKVVPPGAPLPGPEDLERTNLELARGQHRDPTRPEDPWSWAGEADGSYATPWIALAKAYGSRGDAAAASRCIDRVGAR
jgi:dolichyl-phosphate-mannose-protein mannosyltransferase